MTHVSENPTATIKRLVQTDSTENRRKPFNDREFTHARDTVGAGAFAHARESLTEWSVRLVGEVKC